MAPPDLWPYRSGHTTFRSFCKDVAMFSTLRCRERNAWSRIPVCCCGPCTSYVLTVRSRGASHSSRGFAPGGLPSIRSASSASARANSSSKARCATRTLSGNGSLQAGGHRFDPGHVHQLHSWAAICKTAGNIQGDCPTSRCQLAQKPRCNRSSNPLIFTATFRNFRLPTITCFWALAPAGQASPLVQNY
jgi:hypothetical protein